MAFNGDVCRDLAAHVLALAERQGGAVPLIIGHRVMGVTLLHTGDFAESRAHLDRAFALYDPIEHRALATRFATDPGVGILAFRSWVMWHLGYPEAALADADRALQDAREFSQAVFALSVTAWTQIFCGNYAAASSRESELVALADEKGTAWWKALGTWSQGVLFVLALLLHQDRAT